jgi:hypothetical protein
MLALTALGGADDVPMNVRQSLVAHAVFVEANLEHDVGGNHLLKNLKALVFAGAFWSGSNATRWRSHYAEAFIDQLQSQMLPDGGHYERSPMYHCQVLADALEVAAVLSATDPLRATQLNGLAARMASFLDLSTHPDGEIALMNDSVFGVTPPPAILRQIAEEVTGLPVPSLDRSLANMSSAAKTGSGYVLIPPDTPRRFLIADAGQICPEDLPAHGHADLLSFEASIDGQRMIVDSGVGEYAAGAWRSYFRSTRAHNTVSVDGLEQSDCWASFRVGHRAHPVNVSVSRTASDWELDASHDGFEHFAGKVRHRRRIRWIEDQDLWMIDDVLTGVGRHRWESYCHLHPAAIVTIVGDDCAQVCRGGVRLDVVWFGCDGARVVSGESDPYQGWYAERFGPAVPAPVLVLNGEGPLPATFGFALIPQPIGALPARLTISSDGRPIVERRPLH